MEGRRGLLHYYVAEEGLGAGGGRAAGAQAWRALPFVASRPRKFGPFNKAPLFFYRQFCVAKKQISMEKWVLVTGGTGFVGVHAVLQLLQKGYNVKTTLRSMGRRQEVLDMLRNGGWPGADGPHGGVEAGDRVRFVEADLTKDDGWNEAVRGVEYVLHVASPLPVHLPKDENELIRPAVDGTLRVLRAARDAGVRRVVVTSNFGAVGYSYRGSGPITEENWTDPDQPGLSSYNKSKVLAEKAAWEFIRKEGGRMELAVVNPVAIMGPALGRDFPSGFQMLENIMTGKVKRFPRLELGVVDVRDVADLHIRAMTNPAAAGQRFLCQAGPSTSLAEIAALIKLKMPDLPISSRIMPDWVVRMAAPFNAQARTVAPMLGINRNLSTEKARTVLGWQPRSKEEAIMATAECLVTFGIVK